MTKTESNTRTGAASAKRKRGVTVICYGRKEFWTSRKKAIQHYMEGLFSCEGAEAERYKTIVAGLVAGRSTVTDECP